MENLNAKQLALIMGVSKKDAAKKIIIATERLNGNNNMLNESYFNLYGDNPSISIEDMSKYLDRDLNVYLTSIKQDYLKNSSTRNFIFDYPTSKMKPNKETGLFPKTISIPSDLRSLLTEEQCNEIILRWKEIYKDFIIEHGITFK